MCILRKISVWKKAPSFRISQDARNVKARTYCSLRTESEKRTKRKRQLLMIVRLDEITQSLITTESYSPYLKVYRVTIIMQYVSCITFSNLMEYLDFRIIYCLLKMDTETGK